MNEFSMTDNVKTNSSNSKKRYHTPEFKEHGTVQKETLNSQNYVGSGSDGNYYS